MSNVDNVFARSPVRLSRKPGERIHDILQVGRCWNGRSRGCLVALAIRYSSQRAFPDDSAEVVTLLQSSEYGWGLAAVSPHVLGSLTLTIAGILLVRFLLSLEVL